MALKLWVDDLRRPPDGWPYWAKTSAEAITVLKRAPITEMSLDHDLGGEDTTRPVVLWLCEHPDRWPSIVRVHSMNNVGRSWLSAMLCRYSPHLQ